jgi:hypothetical protein
MSIRKYNLYLFIIFSIIFDDTSTFDETAKQENIITNTLYLNLLNCDSHLLISLINETNMYDKLIEKIENTLKDININEDELERKKRVLISNELFSFENIEIVNEMIIDNIIFENYIENKMIDLIKSLNKKELDNILEQYTIFNAIHDLTEKQIIAIRGSLYHIENALLSDSVTIKKKRKADTSRRKEEWHPYLLFCKMKREELQAQGISGNAIMKQLSHMWKNLSEKDKQRFVETAKENKRKDLEKENQENNQLNFTQNQIGENLTIPLVTTMGLNVDLLRGNILEDQLPTQIYPRDLSMKQTFD